MSPRRSFTRASEESRRADLIDATLDLIAEGGPQAATVRAIALRAGVTPGLIRHYFATKEELVAAAHEHLMTGLTQASTAQTSTTQTTSQGDARAQFVDLITRAVSPPVTEPRSVALWAASMQLVPRDATMRAVHEDTYLAFRDRLEQAIAQVLAQAGRDDDPRPLAIAGNALLDGLWIEAGALPEHFREGELSQIALMAFSRLLDLDLCGSAQ